MGAIAAIFTGMAKTGLPGSSLPSVLLMAEAFPDNAKASVSAIVPALLVGDLVAVFWYRRHADWSQLVRLAPYVIAGMIPGIFVLHFAQGNQLRPVLGWLVLTLLAVELCRQRYGWEHLPGQWWFVGSMGFLAGFGTIVGNAAGPIMSIYFIAAGLRKEQFIGTSAWFFFLVNSSKIPIMGGLGMLTPDTLSFGLTVALAVPLGSALGIWIFRALPQRPFNLCALALAGLAACHLVFGTHLTIAR